MCQADRCDFFSLRLMNFSFTAEADSLKLLMEKTRCSDFDGTMNVWVSEGSDFCAKNYSHSVVQTWGKDCAAATLHRAGVSLKVWQYKGMVFFRKMIICISLIILRKHKGFSEVPSGH